ncbi:hypothetical protein CfE428DRAFT_6384 [Chthoniobacter flavus Ellin428]|uniref:Uncharacterized protein n=1 Tax=Chthoniobacter flavus Ellin428 TaxID=497964 RepID=B4DBU3_9BACT|nr:hypothetical protein CfE428DRAFT_6384 [Chthoniobacter flavus Ellin428]
MRFALAFHPIVKYDLAEAEHWYASLDRGLGLRNKRPLSSRVILSGVEGV